MAINTQKFLPGSKGTAKPLPQAKISSITLTSQDKKNVNTIRVKTIQIDKMLKGTLAADKKLLNDKKKEASQQRKEDIETKLEKKPDLKKKIKMPNVLPKTGFLDWIKNFIGNVLLGYFAVRLIEHLPALKGLLTGIVAAGEFIIDWGGKILNGLVSFVDGAYKLYDGLRKFTGDIFGEDGVKKFDSLMGTLNTVLKGTFLLAMAMSKVGGGKPGKPGTSGKPGGGRGTRTTSGGRTIGRPGIRNPFRARPNITGTASKRLAAKVIKPLVNKIPLIGGLLEFAISWALGDPVGKAAFRGIGSLLLGTIGTVIGGPIGAVLGTWAGAEGGALLYDMIFSNKKPSPNKVPGHKGGGKVKNNKPRKARRTLTSRRSTSRKVITPPNIQNVKIDPGKSISGTEEVPVSPGETEVKSKIFGLFPNPWANLPKEKQPSEPSALDFIKKYGDKFGEMSYFGPMASLAVKALVGQKPSNKEYNDAGKGLSYLVGAGTPMGFAGGGSVAQRREKEISDKISKQLKKTMDPIVNSVIGDIEKSLSLSNEWDSATGTGRVRIGGGPSGAGSTYSTSSSGEYGDILDLISSVEAKSYDTINGGHIDGLSTMTIAGARRAALDSGIGSGAMGRYQQMPQFVLERARSIGLDPNKDLFSPENQDKLAILLIDGGGYKSWKSGSMTTEKFAYNLAGTWRGLPEGPSNLTFQDQYASGNKAHTTWDNVMGVLGGSKTSGSVSSGEYNKGSGQSIQLGTNKDGSLGSKLAGELGNYLKTSLRQGPDFQAVTEHSQHGGVRGRHAKNSYHYSDRAIDIGAWDWEQPKILAAISNFNKLKGISPVELLHAGNEPSGHSDHVHVAYHKGGYVWKDGTVHKGEIVIDRDSSITKATPMLLAINAARDEKGVLKAISDYAPYESILSHTKNIIVEKMIPVPIPSKSGGGVVVIGGGGGNDPFSSLGLNA
jgi:hypothetical protein